MRYFFDFIRPGQSLYDYRGDVFISTEDACDYAMATAERLSNSLSNDWKGWSVEVRSPEGQMYISIPINRVIQLAAVVSSGSSQQRNNSAANRAH
jgi:hypothetical protein